MTAFLPNKYASCSCMLSEEFANVSNSKICTFFEDNGEDQDICKACFHGADCHLKGHEPNSEECKNG